MTIQAIFTDFDQCLDIWEAALDRYTDEQFGRQPDADNWSIGQVYNHLLDGTQRFHLRQVGQCLDDPAHAEEAPSEAGAGMLAANAFPPVEIKVPASPQYTPRQPQSRAEVRAKLVQLRADMRAMADRLAADAPSGRTFHWTFGHLNAREWYQLIAMHFRHHLRQKSKLDAFIGVAG